MNSIAIVEATKNWIEKVVIQQNFCPFASVPYRKNLVRYSVFSGNDVEEIPNAILQELELLKNTSAEEIETSFLVFPQLSEVFHNFLDLVDLAELILQEADLEGFIQIATFHPKYQFANTKVSDVENYTNRSPYPMLHFLREDSVSKAVMNYENIENVPIKNIELLKKLEEKGQMEEILKWVKIEN